MSRHHPQPAPAPVATLPPQGPVRSVPFSMPIDTVGGEALTPAQIARLFAAASSQPHASIRARDAALLVLAYGLGMRRAEITNTTVADLRSDGAALLCTGSGFLNKWTA